MYIISKFYLDINPVEKNIDSLVAKVNLSVGYKTIVLLNLEKMLELKASI